MIDVDAVRNKLNRAYYLAERALESAGSAVDAGEDVMQKCANHAAFAAEPILHRALSENLAASGIQNRTGQLADMLSKCRINARWIGGGKGVRLFMAMPSIGEFTSGGKKMAKGEEAYRKAAALNWGAVRMPQVWRNVYDPIQQRHVGAKKMAPVGEKAKRTIKKMALGKAVSKRAQKALEAGKTAHGQVMTAGWAKGQTVRTTKKGSVDLGNGTVVIRPKEYFYLSNRQLSVLGQVFEEAFAKAFSYFSSR